MTAQSTTPLLSRTAAAEFLTQNGFATSKRTLDKMAWRGDGPPYREFGRRTLYAPADLLAWANSRLSAPRRAASHRRRPKAA